MNLFDLFFFIGSLFTVWLSSELIIFGIERFSKRMDESTFTTSFFILGLLTCSPELAIGVKSVLAKEPEIFTGDLIGSSMVLFLFVIPLLAIFGNGVKLTHHLPPVKLFVSLLVVIMPVLFTLNGVISKQDGFALIAFYLVIFVYMHRGGEFLRKIRYSFPDNKREIINDFAVIAAGVALITLSSHILVNKTIQFGHVMHISPYLISLLILGVGTNLPEIVIAIRSVVKDKKGIAFGDYVGSAVTNTLLFGIFTVISGPIVIQNENFGLTFTLFFGGIVLFFIFFRTNNILSRLEGIILVSIYILFVLLEILI